MGKRRSFGLLLIACLFVSAGYASLRGARPEGIVGGAGDIAGDVCRDVQYQPDNNRTVLTLDNVTRDGAPFPHRVYVYIYGSAAPGQYEYGQRLLLPRASVWVPKGRTNPEGFDFAAYLWRGGVALCASSSAGKVEILSESASLTRSLYRLRRELGGRIDDMYPDNADVMRALLLGDRSGLSDDTYEDFRRSGIAHLIALSGLHVSCIALLIHAAVSLLMLKRRACVVITVVLLLLYARMTGMSASILRAVIMYALACAARECGYPSDLLTRLGCAFIIQLAIQPLALYDAGFQLSYASILGLALLSGLLRGLAHIRRDASAGWVKRAVYYIKRACVDACSASLAVQLATLPLMASLFYAIPALALPVNLIAIPLGLTTVYAGAISLALHALSPGAARILAILPDTIWTGIRFIAGFTARLPAAVIRARAWPLLAGIVYFAFLALASPHSRMRLKARRLCALSLFVIWLIVTLLPRGASDGLRVTFLDAGYADAAVVDAKGSVYAIDCGREGGILADYLTATAADLRAVFVTHPDTDHAGGLREVLARYDDARVYLPECWPHMDVGEALSDALAGAKVTYLKRGDEIPLAEGIIARVLWPEAGFQPKNDNDGSLVMYVSYEDASALFMGDLTNAHDDNIRADCDLLKVSHHGSKYASSADMLYTASPELAVISVAGNAHGHPTMEVLERLEAVGARVMRTDVYGAITVDMEPNGEMAVKTVLKAGE